MPQKMIALHVLQYKILIEKINPRVMVRALACLMRSMFVMRLNALYVIHPADFVLGQIIMIAWHATLTQKTYIFCQTRIIKLLMK